ncbi:hypothetical protein [Pelagibacterium xiamenense]|uniref:hypothetical protein n=1 Tax=Pelagibacterium xiamenense TaxID=2901140 RepID=UPI001E429DFE|nr:hypothetical protein [Pelagibacterium xiamenense]MCD7059510.1 hypothetical protein [Pelagibacterium xiamenense]
MAAQERKVNSKGTIAVVGDSPFAAFLAGLLASAHGRETMLVGATPSPLRVPRGPALSIAPLLRPESWRLLLDTVPETLRLLARIGPRLSERSNVVLGASGALQSYALEHSRHLAAGFGQAVEPAVPAPTGFDTAYRVRDAHRIVEAAFWSAVPDWLARHNVTTIAPGEPLSLRRDGSGTVGGLQADHVVLADDTAIAAHCNRYDLDAIAHRVAMTAFRTEPAAPLDDPVRMAMGGDFALTQTPDLALDIVAPGQPADAVRHAGRFLAHPASVRLAARSSFDALVPRDGAPVFGRLRQGRATVVFGLGAGAVFVAPAIARLIAGEPMAAERGWAEARRANRDMSRSPVAEFPPVTRESVA